jgi:ADP-ribose pyrophosphatase YjhB (NUDIX family)
MANWLEGAIKNVSTDCVIFGFEDASLRVLLNKRAKNPCKGWWVLPGGFLKKGESTEQTARRILKATTGLKNVYLEQVGVFDEVKRFPSWRVFTVGYFALIQPENFEIIPFGTESIEVRWFTIKEVPRLA